MFQPNVNPTSTHLFGTLGWRWVGGGINRYNPPWSNTLIINNLHALKVGLAPIQLRNQKNEGIRISIQTICIIIHAYSHLLVGLRKIIPCLGKKCYIVKEKSSFAQSKTTAHQHPQTCIYMHYCNSLRTTNRRLPFKATASLTSTQRGNCWFPRRVLLVPA